MSPTRLPLICRLVLVFLAASSLSAETRFTAAELREDFRVLRKAYESLHPGLYKYRSKEQIDAAFDAAEARLDRDQSLASAYRVINELTAACQCGHSYPNFYNQEPATIRELFDGPTCLPFHFRIVDDHLVVVRSADPAVPPNTVVAAINGHAVSSLVAQLLPFVRADGASDGKRLRLLEILGQNKYEYFDILYPLYHPSESGAFTLDVVDPARRPAGRITVPAVTREAREKALEAAGQVRVKRPPADFRWLAPGTALLELNSLVNWNKEFNHAAFFDRSAVEYGERNGRALILDIRELEGGSFDVALDLLGHLTRTELSFANEQSVWAYTSIDRELEPSISNQSWAGQHMYRNAADFVRLPGGQFQAKVAAAAEVVRPSPHPFAGRILLLTSATNSSAGFQLAEAAKRHGLATLVGETTGGNQRGITGGTYFFIVLPHSRIEVDVPLKGYDYAVVRDRPDRGIEPDHLVRPGLADVLAGRDVVLEKAISLLRE